MAMGCTIVGLLWCFIIITFIINGDAQAITSYKQWQRSIYIQSANRACVRLVNATSIVGCATPQGSRDIRGILTIPDAAGYNEPDGAVFVVPPSEYARLWTTLTSNTTLVNRTHGIVLTNDRPAHFSPAPPTITTGSTQLPGQSTHVWNPWGDGSADVSMPFPVFLLDGHTSHAAAAGALHNHQQHYSGPVYVAVLTTPMHALVNASTCLPNTPWHPKTCDPLGGHSVFATLPPLPIMKSMPMFGGGGGGGDNGGGNNGGGDNGGGDNGGGDNGGGSQHNAHSHNDNNDNDNKLPWILVAAGMDPPGGLFHDTAVGADDPMSGLIAMLTALDILVNASVTPTFKRPLVFAAITGDAWGAMGTRRFLWSMHQGANATKGLHWEGLHAAVEVGPVGRANTTQGVHATLYGHHAHGAPYAVEGTAGVLEALRVGAEATGGVVFGGASAGVLPPGVLGALLRVVQVPAVLVAEYDTEMVNPYYASVYDDVNNVNGEAIAAAAQTLARALAAVATDDDNTARSLMVDSTAALTTVNTLLDCLLRPSPGLTCPLASSVLLPGEVSPGQPGAGYVGILPTITVNDQDPIPGVKKPVERVVWEYMAQRVVDVHDSVQEGLCDFRGNMCPDGYVCMGHRYIGKKPTLGTCYRGTTRYVPSYSLRVEPTMCTPYVCSNMSLTDTAVDFDRQYGFEDGMWSESIWPPDTPDMMVFLQEAPLRETAALVGGVAVTCLAMVGVLVWHVALSWQKKVQ